jgi:hypothetical protein
MHMTCTRLHKTSLIFWCYNECVELGLFKNNKESKSEVLAERYRRIEMTGKTETDD